MESPVKLAVEIADECSEMIQNNIPIERQDLKTERGERRAKSNVAECNLDQGHPQLQMSARRLRSARKNKYESVYKDANSQSKSPATPSRRDVEKAKQLGAELSAKRYLQARQAKVDLASEYGEDETGRSASRNLELQSQLSTSKLRPPTQITKSQALL